MYNLKIVGEQQAKQFLAGHIVCNSGNLVRSFQLNSGDVNFIFRYRSDARLVLKRVARNCRLLPPKDLLTYNGATASISKTA